MKSKTKKHIKGGNRLTKVLKRTRNSFARNTKKLSGGLLKDSNNIIHADVNMLTSYAYNFISENINNYVKSINKNNNNNNNNNNNRNNNTTKTTKYDELIKNAVNNAYEHIYYCTEFSDIYKMMIAYNDMIHKLILYLHKSRKDIINNIKSLLLVYYNRKIYLNELYIDILNLLNTLVTFKTSKYPIYPKDITRIFKIKFNILKKYINIHIPIMPLDLQRYDTLITEIDTINIKITSILQNANDNNTLINYINQIISNINEIRTITNNIMDIPNESNINYINLIYHIIKLILNENNNKNNNKNTNNNETQITMLINFLISNTLNTSLTNEKFTINTLISYLKKEIDTLLIVYNKDNNDDLRKQIKALTIDVLERSSTDTDISSGI